MLIGVVFLLAWRLVPVPFTTELLVLGLLSIILAVVTHILQPQGHVRKYWRGRYLDIPSGRWQEHLYRIIYRQGPR